MRLPYRGDRLQASRDRVSAYWKRAGWSYARRLGKFAAFGPGAIAAAGLSNYFSRVPDLKQEMRLIGSKRRRSAGAVKKDQGGYVQLTYDNVNAGRFLSKQRKLNNLLMSHMYPVVERFQNVTNLSSGAGAYFLSWDDTAADVNKLPVYLFDLTAVKNRVGDGVNVVNPYPFTRLVRNKTIATFNTGAYLTDAQYGVDNDGAASRVWTSERVPRIVNSVAVERALIEWCDIRYVLYGARKCPSSITVMIVQFLDEDQVPGAYSDSTTLPSGVVETEAGRITDADDPKYNRWQTAWQGFVDNATGSVINVRDLKEQGLKLKVNYSKTYKFNPTMSTESDQSGHQVAVKFRYNMNKLCTYVEDPRGHAAVTVAEEVDPNEYPVYSTDMYSTTPAARGREFLIIKGYAGKPNSALGTDSLYDYAPSFDMIVRRKRTHMRN